MNKCSECAIGIMPNSPLVADVFAACNQFFDMAGIVGIQQENSSFVKWCEAYRSARIKLSEKRSDQELFTDITGKDPRTVPLFINEFGSTV